MKRRSKTNASRIRSFWILLLALIAIAGCGYFDGHNSNQLNRSIPKLQTIPDREIMFYAEGFGGNVLGFVHPDGSEVEYRRVDTPYPLNNYVRWGMDGDSIVGRMNPSPNPNAAYPFLITSEGETFFCEIVGYGYAWGIGDTKVMTNDVTEDRIVLVDMKTCDILSIIYERDIGIPEITVSTQGLIAVGNIVIDENGAVLFEKTEPGMPLDWSPDNETLLVQNDGLWILNTNTMSNQYMVDGGWGAWSPSGESIIYTVDSSIFTLNVETGEPSFLIEGGLSPSWRTIPP